MAFKQFQAALVSIGSNLRSKDNVGVFGIGLAVLALQMQTGCFNLANAEEVAEPPLYPAGHVAHCKPAPGFGCICDTDSTSQVSAFSSLSSETRNDIDQIQDVELRRLVEWMRLTCAAVTQPTELR